MLGVGCRPVVFRFVFSSGNMLGGYDQLVKQLILMDAMRDGWNLTQRGSAGVRGGESLFLLCFIFFWLLPTMEAQCLNHWTAREVSGWGELDSSIPRVWRREKHGTTETSAVRRIAERAPTVRVTAGGVQPDFLPQSNLFFQQSYTRLCCLAAKLCPTLLRPHG